MTSEVPQAHRILVVEDDATIRRLIEKLLGRLGMVVDVAADGLVAIERLSERRYATIVLDLMVPEMNGFEIIDAIKKMEITTPVAVVSAVSQQALTRLDLDVVKVVIAKPFDVDEFTHAITTLCRDDVEEHQAG